MKNQLRFSIAKHCPRLLQSFAYKILYRLLGESYVLDPADFAGKSVLIIGPAFSVYEDLKYLEGDTFDIIVKMNNAIHTEFGIDPNNPLRCDVLFHSFRGSIKPVTAAELQAAKVKTIVHRTLKRRAFLSTLRLEEQFGSVAKIRIVPVEKYRSLAKQLGRAPTTGMICTEFFLQAPVSRLALVGFTFFTTRYVAGYDDTVKTDATALSRVEAKDYHSPLHEARLMQALITQAREAGKPVHVSASMQQAMEALLSSDR